MMITRARRSPIEKRPILLVGTVLFLFSVAYIYGSGFAVEAGKQIYTDDVQRDYLYGIVWAVLIALFIVSWPVNGHDKANLLIAWLAKSYVALVFMLFYERYYSMDCFGYFVLMRWPWYEWSWAEKIRSFYFVALVGWWQERFIDSFHAVKLTFALIGLVAIFLVYRAAMSVVGKSHSDALLLFALFPSILFWSTIIGKDPIVFLGVALYVFGVAKWRITENSWYIAVFAVGIVLSVFMRVWLGAILGLPLVYFGVRGVRSYLSKVAFVVVSAALLAVVITQFASSMNIGGADELVAATDKIAHQFSTATGATGSTRSIGRNFTSVPMMIGFLPVGIFTVLFRPLPGEVRNVFGMLAGLENGFLLYWSYRCARMFIRNRGVRRPLRREPTVIWAVILVITWCAFYGFISFQNLGASVRFRLPIISVFVGLLLAVTWVERGIRAMNAAPAAPPLPSVGAPPISTQLPATTTF